MVKIDDALIEKFLYALDLTKCEQSSFSRLLVKDISGVLSGALASSTECRTSVTRSGRSSKGPIQIVQVHCRAGTTRKVVQKVQFYGEESLGQIPTFDMEDLGILGTMIAPGKFGNVVEGNVQEMKIASKLFDVRFEKASIALWNDGPQFIDFESTMVDATRGELLVETSEMEALLVDVIYTFIMKACAVIGATDKEKQIHDEIARQGM
ncbi:hypothetical protein GOP47_0028057 [Adiantum capillus-veneris]|nr:hypothetical protein GOP47_0028057 [Adiantum capillus-veneris]